MAIGRTEVRWVPPTAAEVRKHAARLAAAACNLVSVFAGAHRIVSPISGWRQQATSALIVAREVAETTPKEGVCDRTGAGLAVSVMGRDELTAATSLHDVQVNTLQSIRNSPGAWLSVVAGGYGWMNMTTDADFQDADSMRLVNAVSAALRPVLAKFVGQRPETNPNGTITESVARRWDTIIDGVRLSAAKYKKSEGYVYEHKNVDQLEDILKKTQDFQKRMIITDGVFSMDGDIAPLPQIVELADKYDAFVMIDDAHASGVLGKNGAGTTSHFDLYGRVDIQLGTLSKALGVVGGYIAGSALLKDWLINRGRPYLFSTAHPPVVAAALIAALDVMETDPMPMRRLWENTKWWKTALQQEGFDTMGSETPITPVYVGDEAAAQEMERRLWDMGVYALSIVYPTVARGKARIRTMPSAAHTEDDLNFALDAFKAVRDEMSVTI